MVRIIYQDLCWLFYTYCLAELHHQSLRWKSRVAKYLSQSCTARKGQHQNLNSDTPDPKAELLHYAHYAHYAMKDTTKGHYRGDFYIRK